MEVRRMAIQKKLVNWVRAKYEQVNVSAEVGLFNYRCFNNAVLYCQNSKIRSDIYECIYIDGLEPVLHYVVLKNGEYREVTLGYLADSLEYYVLRRIPENDWANIGVEFERSLDVWTRQFTTIFDRKVLMIGRIL